MEAVGPYALERARLGARDLQGLTLGCLVSCSGFRDLGFRVQMYGLDEDSWWSHGEYCRSLNNYKYNLDF